MNSIVYVALGLAVILQAGAAFMSLRLIRVTGRQWAWIFIATALLIMTVRRVISLQWFPAAKQAGLPVSYDEFAALAISLFMFAGVAAIRPVFESIRDSRERLELEVRQRETAEESVRLEKRRFQILAENAPYGLLLVDEGGSFQYINPRFQDLFGYELEDSSEDGERLGGGYPYPVYHHGAVQGLVSDLKNSRAGDDTERTYQVRRKGATTKIVHFRAGQLDTGQFIVSCEDISHLKQTEAALLQSKQMLGSILAATPAAITYLEKGKIRWANPAMMTMFGNETEEQYLGKTARAFYCEEQEYDRVLALFKDALHSGTPLETEATFCRSDGSCFHGELKIRALDNSSGQRPLISVITDISERLKAQEELRASEARYKHLYEESQRQYELYRSLLDSSPDAVTIYDMEGRTVYVNDSFTRIFGWTLEEIQGRTIPYLPESEREASMSLIRALLEKGQSCSGFETKRFTKDGRLLDVSASASRYNNHEGRTAGMLVVLSDITQRKLLEEKLSQSAKMEAVGQLAGGLAHDFNNILTAILGYANLLTNERPGGERYRDKLHQIIRAAERASDLTRQLLAFSRKQVLQVSVLSFNEIIVDIERLLKRLIGEDIELATVLDPSVGNVQADPVQIQQILMNLVVNARDAMPYGGQLTLETSNAVLDQEYSRTHPEVEAGPYVMLAVSDSGVGMDSQTLSHVFEPFFTTKETGGGTGLGLSTVYGLVKQHRGHVTVYSEVGHGTTFKIYLPQTKEAANPLIQTQAVGPRPRGNETVLVVEDEEIVRELAGEALSMLGYQTLAAANPNEAIDICNAHKGPIHLLLTDVVLPQMDGRTLFHRLLSARSDLKVLYVSGYTENFIVHHGVLDKDVNFMQKPFNLDSLARKVREILDAA